MTTAKKPIPMQPDPSVSILPILAPFANSIDLYVMRDYYGNGPSLHHFLACVGGGGESPPAMEWFVNPDSFSANVFPVPTVRLRMEKGQELMDTLWRFGLRPTEGSGSAGSLAATEKHLQDMRVIAFKKLGIGT